MGFLKTHLAAVMLLTVSRTNAYRRVLSHQGMPTGPMNTTNVPPPSQPPPEYNPYGTNYKFTGSMAIIVVVVVSAFLFMGFFLFYLRNRWSMEQRIIRSFRLQEQGAPMHHQHHNNSGLDRSIVEKFPMMRYASAKFKAAQLSRSGSMDCAVCLTEFQEDDELRVLPKCGHGFHADCIDMWLLSHSTCPLCRVSLVPSSSSELLTSTNLPSIPNSTELASDPLQAAADPHGDNPGVGSDVVGGDSAPPRLMTAEERNRSLERMAVRALSRNSQSFRKAAQDAELLVPEGGKGGAEGEDASASSSSRRWKSMRKSRSIERHQRISSGNFGEKENANLLVNSEMRADFGLSGDAGGMISRYGSFASASDAWGSDRIALSSEMGHVSMGRSDNPVDNPLGNQEQSRRKRENNDQWTNIDVEAGGPQASLHQSQDRPQTTEDQARDAAGKSEVRVEVSRGL